MEAKEIEAVLLSALNLAEVHVKQDGSHYTIVAVSDEISQLSRVKRQQAIYAPLSDKIADGTMHAISIKTFSEKDWQRERQFHIPS
ncbi:BolA family protein [Alteromonas sp. ASW11-130]|uniref:BolA family protein n=1 Tax=Alteromonas sp. ASW11-130 TaxID=3015775 RepID=UPI00224247F6|nr:BolA/IbaG family iron-sulfur metabolism protein [Alteromonas sp. ASW11-130]MCW8090441.1 BolA/IbaG family iron-sulfur metabolism protein [Alteromonas sp. ASW11-130]